MMSLRTDVDCPRLQQRWLWPRHHHLADKGPFGLSAGGEVLHISVMLLGSSYRLSVGSIYQSRRLLRCVRSPLCIFNNIYPVLWLVYIGVLFCLVKKRTNIRDCVWRKVTVAKALSWANLAIALIWWVAFGLTKRGPLLFTEDKYGMDAWMAYNGIALGVATLFALASVITAFGEG